MAKGHRHMKKLKSEKAKVKLKGSKHLPKGTNVTDTNFKIKQIVVKEQLKTANEAEPLSKRKLNIKELLSRLQHYNTTVKTDAIADLKEIVSVYSTEVVLPNLNQLIQGISHLVLDKEKSVRQESLRLIDLILTKVSDEQVGPFFDILSSYFRCAMTHIDTAIQEDSLLLLDIFLTHIPSLVIAHSNKILDNFFDLISKLRTDSKPGRTLTLNLNSKLTTVKWRIKVLNRLHFMLDAIIRNRMKTGLNDNKNNVNSLKHNTQQIFYPVFQNMPACSINLNNITRNLNQTEKESNIVKYIDILVPLLFETWLEVGPNGNNENSEMDITLSDEAVSVLNCILNIIQLLYNYLKIYGQETGEKEIVNQFILNYQKGFSKYIISYFPYSKILSKKRKRNEKGNEVNNSAFCILENIMICNLFCMFNKKLTSGKKQKEIASKLITYIHKIFASWKPETEDQNKQTILLFKSLLLDVSETWVFCKDDLLKILDLSIDLYDNKISKELKIELFNILCEIIHYEQLNKSKQFQIWLSTLPNLLCKKVITQKSVNMISLLIKQNNSLFNDTMKNKFNQILENVADIKIVDTEDEIFAKCKIIGLVHYIPAENILDYANTIIKSNCDDNLKRYFIDIAILRFEQNNEEEQIEMLRNMY